MASARRTAHTLLAGACVVPLLAVPGVASAAPPEHAAAHGQQPGSDAAPGRADDGPSAGTRQTASATESSGRTGQGATDDRPAGRDSGRRGPPARDGGTDRASASTTSASTSTTSSSPARGSGSSDDPTASSSDDRPGRGLGRGVPPGRATDGDGGGREATGGATTPAAPATTSTPSTPSTGPAMAGPVAGPAAPSPQPALAPPPTFAVTTPSPGAPSPAGTEVPATPSQAPPEPVALDLDQRLQAMLDDVAGSVGPGIPNVLGRPVPEPLSELVPTLLLILGAFLVVQRGIGRGLGHVPMAGGTGPGRTPRS